MLEALSPAALIGAAERDRVAVRPARWLRRMLGWLLLAGWIVLPLLPMAGLVLSRVLGIGLF